MTDIIKFNGTQKEEVETKEDLDWLNELEDIFDEDDLDEDDDDFEDDDIQLPDVPEEVIESIYAMAYQFYESGDYEKAENTFGLLMILSPDDARHWLGLASTCQMTKDYPTAVVAYGAAAMLNPENPHIPLNAAECYFAAKQIKEGIDALQHAEEIALENKTVYADVLNQVSLLREAWDKNDKKKISIDKEKNKKGNPKK